MWTFAKCLRWCYDKLDTYLCTVTSLSSVCAPSLRALNPEQGCGDTWVRALSLAFQATLLRSLTLKWAHKKCCTIVVFRTLCAPLYTFRDLRHQDHTPRGKRCLLDKRLVQEDVLSSILGPGSRGIFYCLKLSSLAVLLCLGSLHPLYSNEHLAPLLVLFIKLLGTLIGVRIVLYDWPRSSNNTSRAAPAKTHRPAPACTWSGDANTSYRSLWGRPHECQVQWAETGQTIPPRVTGSCWPCRQRQYLCTETQFQVRWLCTLCASLGWAHSHRATYLVFK